MSTSTIRRKTGGRYVGNWQEQTNVFNHNDLIEAYIKGKEAGKTEQQRVNQSLFNTNLQKAQSVSEELFAQLNDAGLKINAVHLKADAITRFDALFVSDKKAFLKDDFRNAFILARRFKQENETETFDISFTFTPDSNTLDENCLTSDGFFIKYYGEK